MPEQIHNRCGKPVVCWSASAVATRFASHSLPLGTNPQPYELTARHRCCSLSLRERLRVRFPRTNLCFEPLNHPITQPEATLSPIGGEGRVRGLPLSPSFKGEAEHAHRNSIRPRQRQAAQSARPSPRDTLHIQYHQRLPPLRSLFQLESVQGDGLYIHSLMVPLGVQLLSLGIRTELVLALCLHDLHP